MMRRLQTLLLASVAVCALGAVAASGASAAEWLLNGKPIVAPATVDSSGKLLFADMKGGLGGGPVRGECEGTDKGTVGPGAADEETAVTETSCTTIEGFCPGPKMVALNLPWKTTLDAVNSDLLLRETGKEVGWEVSCTGVKDTCIAESTYLLQAKNLTAAESGNPFADVDETFTKAESEAKPFSCSRGGAKEGLVEGTVLVLDPNGDLSIS